MPNWFSGRLIADNDDATEEEYQAFLAEMGELDFGYGDVLPGPKFRRRDCRVERFSMSMEGGKWKDFKHDDYWSLAFQSAWDAPTEWVSWLALQHPTMRFWLGGLEFGMHFVTTGFFLGKSHKVKETELRDFIHACDDHKDDPYEGLESESDCGCRLDRAVTQIMTDYSPDGMGG